jgi:hypothetical protein
MALYQFDAFQQQFDNDLQNYKNLKVEYDASFTALNIQIQTFVTSRSPTTIQSLDLVYVRKILADDTITDKNAAILEVYKNSILTFDERTELANVTITSARKTELGTKTLLTGTPLTQANTAISSLVDLTASVKKRKNDLSNLKQKMNGLMNSLQLLSIRLDPTKQILVDKISANWLTLVNKSDKVTEWQNSTKVFDGLAYHDIETLDGEYDSASIFQKAKFIKYIIYLIVTIIVGALLCLLLFNPESELLDMFILILAIIIMVYYIYEYYSK